MINKCFVDLTFIQMGVAREQYLRLVMVLDGLVKVMLNFTFHPAADHKRIYGQIGA